MASSPAPSHTSPASGDDNNHNPDPDLDHDNDHDNDNNTDTELDHESTNHDDGSVNNKSSAVKDKGCPYCHQKFTSSSLGRHLDQFISKKKPDGIHNVDEIRRLRGGITRRTARNSHKKEADDAPAGSYSPGPQYVLPSYSELVNKTSTKEEIRFNRPHWQASGVITDTTIANPPAKNAASPLLTDGAPNTVAGQKRTFSTYAVDSVSAPSSDTIRALELSLREVLDAVRVAAQKAIPSAQPFDFDFESQTFPYLCLALLQSPPTLFQSTPFATPTSVPLSPPGADQYQTLRQAIANKIDEWKWGTLSYIQRSNVAGTYMGDEIENVNDQTQRHKDTAIAHLDAAYQNFMSYGPESRHKLWMIELLRAFKTEQIKVKDAKAAAQRLTQEMNQLQQQLDHLSRCQWPREMALWPPDRPTFDIATQDELRKIHVLREVGGASSGAASTPATTSTDYGDEYSRQIDRWDYDRLVSKWRKHVREDRARKSSVHPLQSGHASGPLGASENALNSSPKPISSSTPRIPSSLYRSNAVGTTNLDTLTNHRPLSAVGLSHSATSAENSPQTKPDGISGGTGFFSALSAASSAPPVGGSSPVGGQPSGSNAATGIFGSIPPPPRSRPLGIISDVDEHYVPRLMGLRRDVQR